MIVCEPEADRGRRRVRELPRARSRRGEGRPWRFRGTIGDAAAIPAALEAEESSPESFALLVNSALLFQIDPAFADLAAQALRRTKYQLRRGQSEGGTRALLAGLATVAAVTRSRELAEEVRRLVRVIRRRQGIGIALYEVVRIGMIAAASTRDHDIPRSPHEAKRLGADNSKIASDRTSEFRPLLGNLHTEKM